MTEAWAGCGVRSLQHWLTWQAGISPGHAREVVRLAEARDTHPAIMSTFAAGAISIDQAAAATKAPAYLDEHLAQTVTYATVPQLRTMARAAPHRAPGAEEPGAGTVGVAGRLVRRRRPLPPAWRVGRRSGPSRRCRPHRGPRCAVPRRPSQSRWPDALVEMAHRILDGASGDDRRERFRVNWFINPADPIPAHWSDGLPVPAWLREMLTCDGTVAPVFTDGALPVAWAGHSVRCPSGLADRVGTGSQVSGSVVLASSLAARPSPRALGARRATDTAI